MLHVICFRGYVLIISGRWTPFGPCSALRSPVGLTVHQRCPRVRAFVERCYKSSSVRRRRVWGFGEPLYYYSYQYVIFCLFLIYFNLYSIINYYCHSYWYCCGFVFVCIINVIIMIIVIVIIKTKVGFLSMTVGIAKTWGLLWLWYSTLHHII